ncbi:Dihydrodipicolinate synthase [gamma proteobacterium HdN1]|nr:Dihydrodipicolinate synthase [gamma proteobacterium HdN1]
MITGSIVALVTPMNADGSLNWESLDRLLDWHIEQGTSAIAAVGTTGESATLDVDEHLAVIARCVERVAGRIPVIAGTGANSTREAIDLTAAAKDAKADACLLVAPYYNKPTQEGLYRHHMAIADAVAIPQILYNVPGRTVVDMLPETVLRLSAHPNIVGLKDATGNVERGARMIEECGEGFTILSGDDATAGELMLRGAKGNISVTANLVPRIMAELCAAAIAGNAERARAINQSVEVLHRELFVEANPIPVKWALHEMGRIPEGIRLPLTPLSEIYHERVRVALRETGLIA